MKDRLDELTELMGTPEEHLERVKTELKKIDAEIVRLKSNVEYGLQYYNEAIEKSKEARERATITGQWSLFNSNEESEKTAYKLARDAETALANAKKEKEKLSKAYERLLNKYPEFAPLPQPTVSRPNTTGASAEQLIQRGFIFLEDSEWGNANLYFDSALDINPEYAKAYVGKLCVKLRLSAEEKLPQYRKTFGNEADFKKAIRYADDAYRKVLEEYNTVNQERIAEEKRTSEQKRSEREKRKRQQAEEEERRIENEQRIIEQKRIAEQKRVEEEKQREFEEKMTPIRTYQKRVFDKEREKARMRHEVEKLRTIELNRREIENKKSRDEFNMALIEHKNKCDDIEAEWGKTVEQLLVQSENWASQGLCAHCGNKIGLFRSCKVCKTAIGVPIKTPPKPNLPPMPIYITPNYEDISAVIPDDIFPDIFEIPNDITDISQISVSLGGYEWHVLDVKNGKVLILCDSIIEKKAYYSEHGYSSKYNMSEKEIILRLYIKDESDNTTWEQCTLHEYLNTVFFNKFSCQEKIRMAETNISTNDNLWYGTTGGGETRDRIFLLSIEEALLYLGDKSGDYENRKRWGVDKHNNCELVLLDKDDNLGIMINNQYNAKRIIYEGTTMSPWWLRSPGRGGILVAVIDVWGYINVFGRPIWDSSVAVRPALWLNLLTPQL
jgi:hypothetical protein